MVPHRNILNARHIIHHDPLIPYHSIIFLVFITLRLPHSTMSASNSLRRTLLTSARSSLPTSTSLSTPFYHNFSNTTSKMVVHNLKSKAEYEAAIKEPGALIIDAFATWCGPCKVIAPKLVE